MKNVLILLLGIFVGGVGCCLQPQVEIKPTFSPEYHKSVVKLQARMKDSSSARIATGFAISENKIMTAGHFCINVFFAQVTGQIDNIEVVEVIDDRYLDTTGIVEIDSVDEEKDLCVLKSSWNHKIKPVKFAESYDDVLIWDEVFTIGGPRGWFPSEGVGRVISPKSEGLTNRDKLVVSTPGTFGSSGSPIFNKDGEVIGIVVEKTGGYDNVLLGTHLETINEFFTENYGGTKFLER